jgi:hypothetical protein
MYTIGFTWPVGPDLRWLIHRGRLDASIVFGPILESSRLSLCVCVCVLRASLVVRWTMPRLVFGQVASWCLVLAATSTTRNLEIYDISRVTFNDGVIDLTYLWWYVKVCHRILVDSRAYQNGWHFYDDSSIHCHKLKWEIVTDLLQAYDESSIITIWNK